MSNNWLLMRMRFKIKCYNVQFAKNFLLIPKNARFAKIHFAMNAFVNG